MQWFKAPTSIFDKAPFKNLSREGDYLSALIFLQIVSERQISKVKIGDSIFQEIYIKEYCQKFRTKRYVLIKKLKKLEGDGLLSWQTNALLCSKGEPIEQSDDLICSRDRLILQISELSESQLPENSVKFSSLNRIEKNRKERKNSVSVETDSSFLDNDPAFYEVPINEA